MKSKKWLLSIAILIMAGLTISMIPQGDMPDADGKELWEYMMKKNSYTEWDHWPGMEKMYEGQSPHGAYLKLYVNDVAKKAIKNGKKEMPANAIIVKENYNKEKKLVALTPMYKVKAYNPDAGDWFWAKYATDGKIMAEGKVDGCINCHSKVKQDDYLFSFSK